MEKIKQIQKKLAELNENQEYIYDQIITRVSQIFNIEPGMFKRESSRSYDEYTYNIQPEKFGIFDKLFAQCQIFCKIEYRPEDRETPLYWARFGYEYQHPSNGSNGYTVGQIVYTAENGMQERMY